MDSEEIKNNRQKDREPIVASKIEDSDYKAMQIASDCLYKLKSVITAPLTYQEIHEGGEVENSFTIFGQKIWDIIYEQSLKNLK